MGSIAKLEDKPKSRCRKWCLFVSKGSGENRRQKSRRFNGSWSDAKKALVAFQMECGEVPESSDVTFGAYAESWLSRRKGVVAETTLGI